MKRFICLMTGVLLLCMTLNSAAATAAPEKAVFDLNALGIMSPDETSQDPAGAVTRAEFAQIMARLLDLQAAADTIKFSGSFRDIEPDAPYAGCIEMLAAMGIMQGNPEGYFMPDEAVSFEQAAKILVVSMGYGIQAVRQGGWPHGYVAAAGNIGLLNNVDAKQSITRGDLIILLDNALDIDLLIEVLGSGGQDILKSGETLRTRIMSSRKLYKLRGVITANPFTYTETPVPYLKDNEVVIDSVIYRTGDTAASDLLGNEVDFYAAETDDGYMLTAVRPTALNTVTVVNSDDFAQKNGNILYYYDENGRQKKMVLSDYARVVYNGTRVFSPEDGVYDIANGTLTAIDNNGDGNADIIFVDEYVNTLAEGFDGKRFSFQNNYGFLGKSSLYIDEENESIKMVIIDTEGNTVANIESKTVLSISADISGTRYKIIACTKRVEGVITDIGENMVIIDGTEYKIDSGRTINVKVGSAVILYLDYNDRAVYAESVDDNPDYGYIVGLDQNVGLSNIRVKMLLAGTVDFGVDVNEEDVDDSDQIPYLICKNKNVKTFRFADRVRYKGRRYSGAELLEVLYSQDLKTVSYTLNQDGEINSLTPANFFGGDHISKSKYNVYDKTFGGSEAVKGFAISDSTRVICIPEAAYGNDDYLVTVKIDVDNNSVGYLVSGYDFDEASRKAKLLVVNAAMDSAQVRDVTVTSSRASIVKKFLLFYDTEAEEERYKITILSDDTLQTLETVSLQDKNRHISGLTSGDLICYVKNVDEKLENVLKIRSFSDAVSDMRISSSRYGYTESFGTVINLSANEVHVLTNVLATKISLDINGAVHSFWIPERNRPPIYIYNRSGKTLEAADITDIIPFFDKVYILEVTGTSAIRACVIVR